MVRGERGVMRGTAVVGTVLWLLVTVCVSVSGMSVMSVPGRGSGAGSGSGRVFAPSRALFHLRKPLSVLPAPAQGRAPATPRSPLDTSKTKQRVLFVVGGPGSGKGTLCEQLSKLGHIHISAGSLLRSHIKEGLRGSVNHILNKQEWLAVKDSIEKGRLICSDIMVRLLRHEMAKYEQCSSSDSASMTGRLILLDGFPRNWENHDAWHKFIMMNNESKCSCEVAGYLLLDCSSDVLIERCLSRAKRCAELGGEPRSDDRIDVIKRRVESFHRDLVKVTDHYGSPSVSKVKAGETY